MRIKNDLSLSVLAKEQILNLIKSEGYKYDAKLPTESQIQEMLGVSRATVREALALLENEEIIRKVQGKGSFLRKLPVKIEDGLEELKSITELFRSLGYSPGTKGFKVRTVKPSKEMQQKLNLNSGEQVFTFERIRTADGNPAAYCLDSISARHFTGQVPEINLNNYSDSMFCYLEETLGMRIQYAVAEIVPVLFEGEMCKKLGLAENTFFLLLKQVHYDDQGNPVIYSQDYFNTNIFKFIVNRTRKKSRGVVL